MAWFPWETAATGHKGAALQALGMPRVLACEGVAEDEGAVFMSMNGAIVGREM